MLSTLLKPIGGEGQSPKQGRGAATPLIPHNNPENRIHWIIPPKKFLIKYP